MREILFRGKAVNLHNGSKDFVYGQYVQNRNGKFIYTDTWEEGINKYQVIEKTIGQYTSLTDKNGVKIFEGDILKSDDLYEEPLLVTFNEKCSAFQVLFKDGYSEGFLEQYTNVYHLEVIGNIHDNAELLKGGEG